MHALRKKRPQLASSLDHVILHQDNAPAHTSQKTQLEFQCLKHPPYSPDLAPLYFAVFPYIKSFLRGMRFDNLGELRQAIMNVIFLKILSFRNLKPSTINPGFPLFVTSFSMLAISITDKSYRD